ncbi:hypothetical protein KY289_005665 [Solanum tuberosum]|nr:hypothetical protein KY289_005665 [Solanum tuberosum]
MKDLGPLHFFLGVKVKYFEGGFHLSHSKYASKLLDRIKMSLAKVVATPLAQNHGLQEVVGSLVDVSLYRMIVESLQYLTLIRHDITHAVNLANQFMQSPNIEHLHGVKRILRYINDASWGGCTITRRSTTSYNCHDPRAPPSRNRRTRPLGGLIQAS